MPTSLGDSIAPPRPDRGTVSRQLPAPAPPATARFPAGPAEGGPDAAALPVPADAPAEDARGCLFALSQPPLMLFLTVIGTLIGLGAAWDLLFV